MQLCAVTACHFHRHLCTLHARLTTTYLWMVGHVRVVAVESFCLCHVGVDDGRVFTMCHYGHGGSGKDSVECLLLVHEHVAGRRAHKKFYAWHRVWVKRGKLVGVVVGGSEEEGVVHHAVVSCHVELLLQCFKGCGLRHRVGHVEVSGDSTRRSRP